MIPYYWLQNNAGWIALAMTMMWLIGLLAAWLTLIYLPADHFVRLRAGFRGVDGRISALKLARFITMNLAGGCLTLVGMVTALPLVPGPGLLLIVSGLLLMSFPGKRALELRLLRLAAVRSAVNRIRDRAGAARLVIPAAAIPAARVQS